MTEFNRNNALENFNTEALTSKIEKIKSTQIESNEIDVDLKKNSLIIDSDIFSQMKRDLEKNPGNTAVLPVEKVIREHALSENELHLGDYKIIEPLALRKFRIENNEPFIEISFADREYANAGYLSLLFPFSTHSNYVKDKEFFSAILIENTNKPSTCSGILYTKNKFHPLHQVKVRDNEGDTYNIDTPDLSKLKTKNK